MAFRTRLEQESGVRDYSLFFEPTPEARAKNPHLQHLWDIGPTAAPYDTMHFVLLNFVPHLWKPFAGLKLVNKKKDEECIIQKATVALIGQELAGARHTVPRAPARSERNIDAHHTLFKAVDWMHFIQYSGEVLLVGRIPGAFYDISMALSRACRLLLRPRGVPAGGHRPALSPDQRRLLHTCRWLRAVLLPPRRCCVVAVRANAGKGRGGGSGGGAGRLKRSVGSSLADKHRLGGKSKPAAVFMH